MSEETAATFRALREMAKERRRQDLPRYTGKLLRLVQDRVLEKTEPRDNGTTWRVWGSKKWVDYWPATGTWYCPLERISGHGIRSLVSFVNGTEK